MWIELEVVTVYVALDSFDNPAEFSSSDAYSPGQASEKVEDNDEDVEMKGV